jgi:CheY-like chemotaxis protein
MFADSGRFDNEGFTPGGDAEKFQGSTIKPQGSFKEQDSRWATALGLEAETVETVGSAWSRAYVFVRCGKSRTRMILKWSFGAEMVGRNPQRQGGISMGEYGVVEGRQRSLRILMVDDSQDDVFFVQKALAKSGLDQSLNSVKDGQEAIAYLKGEGQFGDRCKYPFPNVILCDVKMPGMDGFGLFGVAAKTPGVFGGSGDHVGLTTPYGEEGGAGVIMVCAGFYHE